MTNSYYGRLLAATRHTGQVRNGLIERINAKHGRTRSVSDFDYLYPDNFHVFDYVEGLRAGTSDIRLHLSRPLDEAGIVLSVSVREAGGKTTTNRFHFLQHKEGSWVADESPTSQSDSDIVKAVMRLV